MNPPGRYFFTIALKLNCKLVQLKRTSRTGLMEKMMASLYFLISVMLDSILETKKQKKKCRLSQLDLA